MSEDLANILKEFEALSSLLERFITAHESDQLSGEILFAAIRAMNAIDRAADLIRRPMSGQ